MLLLTHWTGEYETQRVRHPSISMDIFVAVDHECAILSRNVRLFLELLSTDVLCVNLRTLIHSLKGIRRISGLPLWEFISQLIQ